MNAINAFRPALPSDLPQDYRRILQLIVSYGPMSERSVVELSQVPSAALKLGHLVMADVGLVETVQVAGSRFAGYRATHKGRRWARALENAVGVAAPRALPFTGTYRTPECPTYRPGQGRAFAIRSVGVSC